jgi:hypothetical protein
VFKIHFNIVSHTKIAPPNRLAQTMFPTCIQKVLGSNLDRDTNYPDEISLGVSQPLQIHAGIVYDITSRPLSSISPPILNCVITLQSMGYRSVVK